MIRSIGAGRVPRPLPHAFTYVVRFTRYTFDYVIPVVHSLLLLQFTFTHYVYRSDATFLR